MVLASTSALSVVFYKPISSTTLAEHDECVPYFWRFGLVSWAFCWKDINGEYAADVVANVTYHFYDFSLVVRCIFLNSGCHDVGHGELLPLIPRPPNKIINFRSPLFNQMLLYKRHISCSCGDKKISIRR